MNRKFLEAASFTLVELLVVIGILAILTATVVVTLNPAELLRQARDSNRMTDLTNVDKALSLLLTQQPETHLGLIQTVYTSLPDSSLTCANHILPVLPNGYQYHCVTEKNLQNNNGTGWVPVNFTTTSIQSLSSLPIDPTNTANNNLYYTYVVGGSWHLLTLLESSKYTPKATDDGGISPSAYEKGSNLTLYPNAFPAYWVKVPGSSIHGTSDFYVMQYEAKNISGTPTSQPNQNPWVSISQIDAITKCQSINADLITNAQWQTIVYNILDQDSNWSGGSVGSGSVNRGNSDSSGAQDGSVEYGTGYSDITHLRTHVLSTGVKIWDVVGNVHDLNKDTILGTNKPVGVISSWTELTNVSDFGTLNEEDIKPSNSSWNTTQGMGLYYQGSVDGAMYAFLRGGSWDYGTAAGVETLALSDTPSSTGNNCGFRCSR